MRVKDTYQIISYELYINNKQVLQETNINKTTLN